MKGDVEHANGGTGNNSLVSRIVGKGRVWYAQSSRAPMWNTRNAKPSECLVNIFKRIRPRARKDNAN